MSETRLPKVEDAAKQMKKNLYEWVIHRIKETIDRGKDFSVDVAGWRRREPADAMYERLREALDGLGYVVSMGFTGSDYKLGVSWRPGDKYGFEVLRSKLMESWHNAKGCWGMRHEQTNAYVHEDQLMACQSEEELKALLEGAIKQHEAELKHETD